MAICKIGFAIYQYEWRFELRGKLKGSKVKFKIFSSDFGDENKLHTDGQSTST